MKNYIDNANANLAATSTAAAIASVTSATASTEAIMEEFFSTMDASLAEKELIRKGKVSDRRKAAIKADMRRNAHIKNGKVWLRGQINACGTDLAQYREERRFSPEMGWEDESPRVPDEKSRLRINMALKSSTSEEIRHARKAIAYHEVGRLLNLPADEVEREVKFLHEMLDAYWHGAKYPVNMWRDQFLTEAFYNVSVSNWEDGGYVFHPSIESLAEELYAIM